VTSKKNNKFSREIKNSIKEKAKWSEFYQKVLSNYLWRKHYTNIATQEVGNAEEIKENTALEEDRISDDNCNEMKDKILSSFGEEIPQFCEGGFKFINCVPGEQILKGKQSYTSTLNSFSYLFKSSRDFDISLDEKADISCNNVHLTYINSPYSGFASKNKHNREQTKADHNKNKNAASAQNLYEVKLKQMKTDYKKTVGPHLFDGLFQTMNGEFKVDVEIPSEVVKEYVMEN
jgi:hypothetical protein